MRAKPEASESPEKTQAKPSISRTATGVAAAALTIVGPIPTASAQAQFHEYSVGYETDRGNNYTGLLNERGDRLPSGIPPNGCSQPYTGDPVYQSMWMGDDDGQEWEELGTGHQCSSAFRYHFWGYAEDGNWTSWGWQSIGQSTDRHKFEMAKVVESHGQWKTHWKIDNVTKGTRVWSVTFDHVVVGLESYANIANVSSYDNGYLYYQYSLNTDYIWWYGKDDERVDSSMSGSWPSHTIWRSAQ